MNTNEKIDYIRQLMKAGNIAAIIIPSDDPHGSEYVAEYWQARKWITGFSGSAGTAVITREHAILWTDFRYYIQAEKQIVGSGFELYKMGEPDVPTFQKWLTDLLKPGDTIGIDANVFSMANVKKYKTQFEDKGLLLDTAVDYISGLWIDRPKMPMSSAFFLLEKYAGESRKDKIKKIRRQMDTLDVSYHLMSTLDDIAWILNLRGQDVHTNPVNIAFVLIAPKKVWLFINKKKVNKGLEKELNRDGIEVAEYEDVYTALLKIQDGKAILVDPENTNYRLYRSINKKCKVVEKPNPAIALKAIKNDMQIKHLRQTAIKDGIAVVNFLFWLEHQDETVQISETSVADKLYAFRKDQTLFVDNSFDPIMAYQDHSAMCHYSATGETNAAIGSTGMFLTDSGGNYLTGTTDITRTICRGEPSEQEIRDYTLVLKGHISVATALFPRAPKAFRLIRFQDSICGAREWISAMAQGMAWGFFYVSMKARPG